MKHHFKVIRTCNAEFESPLHGFSKTQLIADLKNGIKKCPVEGLSVVVESDSGGSNIVASAVLKNPEALCTNPCGLCRAKITRSSGFSDTSISEQTYKLEIQKGSRSLEVRR